MKHTKSKRILRIVLFIFIIALVACSKVLPDSGEMSNGISTSLQNNIQKLINQGKTGTVLQQLVMERAAGIAPQNRPYSYDGYGDCYGFCRQLWNAILYDGTTHPEDYYPNAYNKARWHSVVGGLPVATGPDPDWVPITNLDVLLPGDVVATHQGHMWGSHWHGGIYAEKINGVHYDYDCYYPDGAYKRPFYSGFKYYFKPIHDLLARNSSQNPATNPIPSSVMNPDGRLEVFMRGRDGKIYHCWQNSANGTWSKWYPFTGTMAGNPVPAKEADGAVVVFARGTNGATYIIKQRDGWSTWYNLGGVALGDPAVAANENGRLEFFVRGTDGAIYKKYQLAANGAFNSQFDNIGGASSSRPEVINNQDGRLEVFVRWNTDGIYHKWQNTPNGGWFHTWDGSLAGGVLEEPYAFQSDNFDSGKIYIFVRGNNNTVYYKCQTAANQGWISNWIQLGSFQALSKPAAGLNTNGTLMIFARGSDNAVWSNRFTPGSGWSGWSSHGGVISSAPTVMRYQDGRLAIVVRGSDGKMYIRKQSSASSTYWTGWQLLGDDVNRF